MHTTLLCNCKSQRRVCVFVCEVIRPVGDCLRVSVVRRRHYSYWWCCCSVQPGCYRSSSTATTLMTARLSTMFVNHSKLSSHIQTAHLQSEELVLVLKTSVSHSNGRCRRRYLLLQIQRIDHCLCVLEIISVCEWRCRSYIHVKLYYIFISQCLCWICYETFAKISETQLFLSNGRDLYYFLLCLIACHSELLFGCIICFDIAKWLILLLQVYSLVMWSY